MKISELGGEFAFIERIKRKSKNSDVIVDIGDDCAVVRKDEKNCFLYTTDMLIEGDHFSLDYFKGEEIGIKAMESNVSDIAAMGGKVLYGFISLALKSNTTVDLVDSLYKGIYEISDRYNFEIIGGDTTHSEKMVVSITLIGEVERRNLKLRSYAEEGDLIVSSGPLGGSTAGLRLFLKGIKGYNNVKKYHTNPKSQMENIDKIIPIAKAMEDVSDGLASEVRNICKMSQTGAIIYKDKIPLSKGIRKAAEFLGDDPYDYALFGGEDFQLVYTVSSENKNKIFGKVVGEIIKGKKIYLDNEQLIDFGYDHFK